MLFLFSLTNKPSRCHYTAVAYNVEIPVIGYTQFSVHLWLHRVTIYCEYNNQTKNHFDIKSVRIVFFIAFIRSFVHSLMCPVSGKISIWFRSMRNRPFLIHTENDFLLFLPHRRRCIVIRLFTGRCVIKFICFHRYWSAADFAFQVGKIFYLLFYFECERYRLRIRTLV